MTNLSSTLDLSSTLETVIALVTVLLVLSLIVQAIQSLIKKLFKLKSRIVLNSLKDLFKYIEVQNPKGLVDRVIKEFEKLGVKISDWMVKVMLYYYYPEYLSKSSEKSKLMGMLLVACENLEAYNNIRRGRDYYGRRKESLQESFEVLKRFVSQKLITKEIYDCLRQLVSSGDLDHILAESRGYRSPNELPREYEEFKLKLRGA